MRTELERNLARFPEPEQKDNWRELAAQLARPETSLEEALNLSNRISLAVGCEIADNSYRLVA